ncbi:hypothetical protein, partial [Robertmurraya kyonggiensis]|uniref:hypothetical protein n=1 Tax=Robertmurraya kyonggiensis TaxID=1037680 RepID=UPI00130EC49B
MNKKVRTVSTSNKSPKVIYPVDLPPDDWDDMSDEEFYRYERHLKVAHVMVTGCRGRPLSRDPTLRDSTEGITTQEEGQEAEEGLEPEQTLILETDKDLLIKQLQEQITHLTALMTN